MTKPPPRVGRRRATNRRARCQVVAHVVALVLSLSCSAHAHAAPVGTAAATSPGAGNSCGLRGPGDTRPRIGLALGGGGARGVAHISVLRKLEALHVPVDCIAGTSMGSLVGGLYASGMPVDALEKLVLTTDWARLFDDNLERKERSFRRKQDDRDNLATLGVGLGEGGLVVSAGMLQGERILSMFERETLRASAIADFDRLPIPFRAVATDLNTGQAVVLDHGSLAMAMRASMSIPGVFRPVEVDGRLLLDGGLANQVPVDVVRAMGADIVIAVDVGTPLAKLDHNAGMLQIVSQLTGMMTTGNTREQLATLGARDVLILPALGDEVATGEFEKAQRALEIGRDAAEAATPRLAVLSVAPGTYAGSVRQRPTLAEGAPVVEFVRLKNETRYADEMLLAYVPIEIGKPLDAERVEHGVLRAYSLDTLASYSYEVVSEDGRTGVLLHAREKPQGPNYVQAGMSLNTDFAGRFESNVRAALLFSPLSPYGAEGRVVVAIGSEPALLGEYYHPFDMANRYLMHVSGGYENPNVQVYDNDGNNTASYDVRRVGAEIQFGREFGNVGILAIGVRRATGSASVEVGNPLLPDFDFDTGELFLDFTVDRLDSLFFPREGYYSQLGYTVARDWLGSDEEYAHVDFDVLAAKSFGKHTLQGGASYHATTTGVLPLQSLYRLGGRGHLVGFRRNELTGQHYGLVFTGYTYQLAKLLGRPAVVGGTLEYGNAWQRREDMAFGDGILNASLYVGFDSWLGPMLFGYGWREHGDGELFLEIGQPF
jgi:NTE family protein